MTMFCTKHSDHNVVTAALEVLQQMLQSRTESLLNILLSPNGILPTVTYAPIGIAGMCQSVDIINSILCLLTKN